VVGRAKRSRTAQGVLAERAALTDMGVIDDLFARGMLTAPMAAASSIVGRSPYDVRTRSVTLTGLAARVLWFDAQVTGALDAGVDQVAVVGAGYDSRAWRFGRDGVRFFEVDHRATQQDKVRRAPRPGPTYVEADLATRGAAGALLQRGLDASRPVLFVVEGVTMYLGEDVVRSQLGDLASSSAAGSRLAVDFQPPRDAGTSRNRRQLRLQRLARIGSGEAFRLLVDRTQATELVETSGWVVEEATSLRDAACALVPRASGLPVSAIDPRKTLVAASRP
jgi:methyltransferase (TIGR00027 family)